jgi:hypothetical protein
VGLAVLQRFGLKYSALAGCLIYEDEWTAFSNIDPPTQLSIHKSTKYTLIDLLVLVNYGVLN